jgi:hypothetical protein
VLVVLDIVFFSPIDYSILGQSVLIDKKENDRLKLAICKLYSVSLKRRIMYIRTNNNLDKPFQMVDFLSLKKKTPSKLIYSHQSKISFPHPEEKTSILLILAIY